MRDPTTGRRVNAHHDLRQAGRSVAHPTGRTTFAAAEPVSFGVDLRVHARRLRTYADIVLYLAEFYLPGSASVSGVVREARAGAAQVARTGAELRVIHAIFVPQDETCFVLYVASSAEEVTAAGARAGLSFDRVVPAFTAP
jgi:hypothetical protein